MNKRLLMGLLATGLMVSLTGCLAPKSKLIDPNMKTEPVAAGVPFTPPGHGYFVPDARMHQILDRLSEQDVFGQ